MKTFVWCVILLIVAASVEAGTYQCTVSAGGEAVLDRAIEADYPGMTREEVIQSMCNREITTLRDRQVAQLSRSIIDKVDVLPPGEQVIVLNNLNTRITAPTVTDITNQTHNVAASPVIAIQATNPYPEKSLAYGVTGLPPGMHLTFVPGTNIPQITGTLTTSGVFNVTTEAWNFIDKKGTDTFVWTVNP